MAPNKQYFTAIKKSLLKFDTSRLDERCTNEAQTRFTLIEPFLEILGYSRIDDMVTEVSAGFGEKNDRADIGLFVSNKKATLKPEIVVECKKFGKKLTDKEASQLNNYFINTPSAKIAILTNGTNWRVYASDSSSKESTLHPMPFIEFDIEEISDELIESLCKLHRNIIDIKSLIEEATEFYFFNKFEDAFFEEILNPSDDFVKAIYSRMGGQRMTDSNRNKIKTQINSTNLRRVTEKLAIEESKRSGNAIITTADELKYYHAVKTILLQRKEIKSDRISYRDQKNSFLVLVDDNQKKVICRLVINHNKRKIEIGTKEFELNGIDSVVQLKKELIESAIQYFVS
jgi:predicted type IV restriction endonuclease